MALLLDTHALLWWIFDDPKLSDVAVARIADPRDAVFVSAASIWEISIKHRLGKLPEAGDVPDRIEEYVERAGFKELPITIAHAAEAGRMDIVHKDPFDRMLIAQGTIDAMPIVTVDPEIGKFAATIW